MATISPDNEYLITLPYPPEISPTELLSRKKSGPGLTKTANAFFVYRKAYVKELKRLGRRIKMTQISGVISYSWSREPEKIRSAYKDIADEASEMFKKINPTPEKQPVTKANNLRGPGGATAGTTTTSTTSASIAAVKSDTATIDALNQFGVSLSQGNVGNLKSLTKKEIAQKFSRFQPYPMVYPSSAYSYYQSAVFEQTSPSSWGTGDLAVFPFDCSTYDTKGQIGTFAVEPFYVLTDDASPIEQPLPSELSSGATTCSPSPSSSPISSNTTYITAATPEVQFIPTFEDLQYYTMPAVPAGSVSQTAYDSSQQLLLQYPEDISDSTNYYAI